LFDAVPDPMIVTNVSGVILRVSKSAGRLLGHSATSLEGVPLADLIPEDMRAEYARHRMDFLAGGEDTAPELETLFMTATGPVIPIDASVGRLQMDDETYLVLVMREVSDRVATQRRLERMVALDELIMSISSHLNTPNFDDIDDRIAQSIGELAAFCSADDAYLFTRQVSGSFRLHSRRAVSDQHRGVVTVGLDKLRWIREVIDGGTVVTVLTDEWGSDESASDRRLLAESGVASAIIIPLRASGRTVGFCGIESTEATRAAWPAEDVSGLVVLQDFLENALERKRIGSELRRANRMLQAVSECNDTLIRAHDEAELLRDVCRIVVETGDYALAWVGYALDDEEKSIVPQAHWGEDRGFLTGLKLSWEDGDNGRGPAGMAVRTRRPVSVQNTAADTFVRSHSRPAQHGFLSVVTVPVFFGDEVAGLLAVYDSDVGAFKSPEVQVLQRFADDLGFGIAALRTRARQVEAEAQLRDLLRSKDELIATIAHELRTPLTGVVGFAQLLRDDEGALKPEARSEMIRLVAEQGMDLTNIVDDLLVAAKAEAGTLEVASVRVDLRAQAAQVLEAWGTGITGDVEFSGVAAYTVGDPARVRQILRNLVSNALRYGGDKMFVRVGAEGDGVYVTVEDDGAGVAPDEHETIFEPYRRAHNAPGMTASMGLGLSISRDLARLMGGDLTYCRDAGRSVFRFAMPATTSASL